MKKKRILIICSVCLAVVLLGGLAASVYAKNAFSWLYPDEIKAREEDAQKEAMLFPPSATTTLPPSLEALKTCPYPELLEKSYAIANAEQKAKLDKIDQFMDYGKYPRQIKTIMGVLPEDAPYLTVEKAIEALPKIQSPGNTEWEYKVERIFNEIAGAPDFVGGSGVLYWIYFTDESHSQYIRIRSGTVAIVNPETGEWQTLFRNSDNGTVLIASDLAKEKPVRNTPYLTVENAMEAYDEIKTLSFDKSYKRHLWGGEVEKLFNKFVGVPDYEGGIKRDDGWAATAYYTDETHSQLIVIVIGSSNKVILYDTETQKSETLFQLDENGNTVRENR